MLLNFARLESTDETPHLGAKGRRLVSRLPPSRRPPHPREEELSVYERLGTSSALSPFPVLRKTLFVERETLFAQQKGVPVRRETLFVERETLFAQRKGVPVRRETLFAQRKGSPAQQKGSPVEQEAFPVQRKGSLVEQKGSLVEREREGPSPPAPPPAHPGGGKPLPYFGLTRDQLPAGTCVPASSVRRMRVRRSSRWARV